MDTTPPNTFKELTASDIRPEVIGFALLMEQKLRDNDFKGGWKQDSIDGLLNHLVDEVAELKRELWVDDVLEGSGYEIPDTVKARLTAAYEAADIANMAMMVADNLLNPSPPNIEV